MPKVVERVLRAGEGRTLKKLEAINAAGIPMLSSCRQGICGTCETGVIAGEIDHRDSVLEDDEREEGDIMMICVSRCKGKELTLEL